MECLTVKLKGKREFSAGMVEEQMMPNQKDAELKFQVTVEECLALRENPPTSDELSEITVTDPVTGTTYVFKGYVKNSTVVNRLYPGNSSGYISFIKEGVTNNG